MSAMYKEIECRIDHVNSRVLRLTVSLNCTVTWDQFNKKTYVSVLFKSDRCFTSSDKFEFHTSVYKFPLQASNLYLQYYFVEFFKFFSRLYMRTLQLQKGTVVTSLLS